MPNLLRPNQVGLVLGGFVGLLHLVWSVLVALNWAQALVNFIFRLHMIQPSHTVLPFSLGLAVGLVVVTALVGYVLGFVFSFIWNTLQKKV